MDLLLSHFTASAECSLKSWNAPESTLDFFNGFWVFICCRKDRLADSGLCLEKESSLFIRRIMSLTLAPCTDSVCSLVIPLICTNNSFKFYRLSIIMFLPIDFSENGIHTCSVHRKKGALSHDAIALQLFAEVDIRWDKELVYRIEKHCTVQR